MILQNIRLNSARALRWQLLASSFGLGLVFSACGGTVSFGSSATQNASSQGSKAGTGGVSKAEPANLPAGGSAPEEFEPSAEAQNVSGSYLVGICDTPNETATHSRGKKFQRVYVECSFESDRGEVEKLSAPQVLLALFDGTTLQLESRWREVEVANGSEIRLVFEIDRISAKNVLSISVTELSVKVGAQISKIAKLDMGLTSQAQEFFERYTAGTGNRVALEPDYCGQSKDKQYGNKFGDNSNDSQVMKLHSSSDEKEFSTENCSKTKSSSSSSR